MTEQSKSNESSNKSLEEKLRSKIAELELKVHEARDELAQANKVSRWIPDSLKHLRSLLVYQLRLFAHRMVHKTVLDLDI